MMRLGKTRTKNIIQFWQKQPDAYHELCRAGALFPIQGIRAGSFSFFINESAPAEWQCKRTCDRFHFHFHHHSNVWIIDGNALYALRLADFPDNGNGEYRITTLNGQTIKTAQKIPAAAGIWQLHIGVLHQPSNGNTFGFGIRFTRDTRSSPINTPRTEFDFDAGS